MRPIVAVTAVVSLVFVAVTAASAVGGTAGEPREGVTTAATERGAGGQAAEGVPAATIQNGAAGQATGSVTASASVSGAAGQATEGMTESAIERHTAGQVTEAATPATAASVSTRENAGQVTPPDNDRARGLVFDGLRPAGPTGTCPSGFSVDVASGTLCTHGPDRAPAGVDVRTPRSTAELRLQTLSLSSGAAPHVHADGTAHDHGLAADDAGSDAVTVAEVGGVPMIGDGSSGNRVLAVYAVASDRPDRYAEVAPLIADWAAHIDAMVNGSAASTGGERHVRFVTDAVGVLAVEKVVLGPAGDDTFANLVSALQAAGYDDPSRKYLVWTDASLYCGIASIYSDDRPTQDNLNNGQAAQYARIDTACWGSSASTELHELVHMMGGVQPSAPNATPGFHCTDEYDRMCYFDSSDPNRTYQCDLAMEAYLDCGHDDYFHTSPPAGSYLANHWNVADSSFLHRGPVDDAPPPANEAPVVTASGPGSVLLADGAAVDGTVNDDGLPGPYTVAWSQASGPGSVTFADPAAEDTTVSFSTAGVYVLTLTADDGELTGSDSVTITVDDDPPPPPGPTSTTEVFDGSLNKKWPARSFQTTVADGPADAVLTFGGRGKKAGQDQLTLNLYDAGGSLLASESGTSPVQLAASLPAGTYTWEVTGERTSFSLQVTYLAS